MKRTNNAAFGGPGRPQAAGKYHPTPRGISEPAAAGLPRSLLEQVTALVEADKLDQASLALRFGLRVSAAHATNAAHLVALLARTPARDWAPRLHDPAGTRP